MIHRILHSLTLVFLFNACVPLPIPTIRDYPEIRGKIIDSSTKRPISDVSIKVVGLSKNTFHSDKNGIFLIKELSEWDIFGCIPLAPVAHGDSEYRYKLQLSHPQYSTLITDLTFGYSFIGWDFCGNGSIDRVIEFEEIQKMLPKQ